MFTQWFRRPNVPDKVGVFMTSASAPRYQHWNGIFWGKPGLHPAQALAQAGTPARDQGMPWRGFAKSPEDRSREFEEALDEVAP